MSAAPRKRTAASARGAAGGTAPRPSADEGVATAPGGAPSRVVARFRLRLTCDAEIILGPGKVDLLEAIARERSITGAAKALGMSYRRAWLLVDTMNRNFRIPLVAAGAGGAHGGGATLTASGVEVVARYRRIEAMARAAASAELRKLKALAQGE